MRFLKQGEQRCLDARQEATNALVDIDDLEVLQTPEKSVDAGAKQRLHHRVSVHLLAFC